MSFFNRTDNLRFSVLGFPLVSPLILPFPFGSFSELWQMAGFPQLLAKEVNYMDVKEFLAEFKEFCEEITSTGAEIKPEQAVSLYAIFRKDIRADSINNNKAIAKQGAKLATERQRKLIENLAKEKGIRISQEEMDSLSSRQASRLIDRLLGGSSPNSFFQDRHRLGL